MSVNSANEESPESVPLMSVGVELHRDNDGRDVQPGDARSIATTSFTDTARAQNVDSELPSSETQDSIETCNDDMADESDQEGSVVTTDADESEEESEDAFFLRYDRQVSVRNFFIRYDKRPLTSKRKQRLDQLSKLTWDQYGQVLGDNLLHMSIRYDSMRICQYLSNKFSKTLVFESNVDGDTPLHLAVRLRSSKAVKILLKSCPPFDIKNRMDLTPLQMAAVSLDFDCLRVLLVKNANTKIITSSSESLVHLACKSALHLAPDDVKQLCDPNVLILNDSRRVFIPDLASMQDHPFDIGLIFYHLDHEMFKIDIGSTLHQLTLLNCGKAINTLANLLQVQGMPVLNEKNHIKITPIQVAAKLLHFEALNALVETRADCTIVSEAEGTVLHMACSAIIRRGVFLDSENVVPFIYRPGEDGDRDSYSERSSEILAAHRRIEDDCKRKHIPLLKVLIRSMAGSPLNFLIQTQATAYLGTFGHGGIAHYLAYLDYAEGINLIMEALSGLAEEQRLFLNDPGLLEFPPLTICAKYLSVEAGCALLRAGANPNCQNSGTLPRETRQEMWTPLHHLLAAVTEANVDKMLPFLEELLQHGADPLKKDANNNSALMYALRSRSHKASMIS